MVNTLEVKDFKSIKHLKLNCKRINIFIGKPNTGKSNILETVGIFSFGRYFHYYPEFRNFVRYERVSNLFYDENLDQEIGVSFDDKVLKVAFKDGTFRGKWQKGDIVLVSFSGSHSSIGINIHAGQEELAMFKFYRFTVKTDFAKLESDFLLPPSGENLLAVLLTHKELKSLARQVFSPFGFELVFKPQENKIEVLKHYEDILISYPYSLVSDTLQRLVFYLVAIESNKDSILAFEEPESHAFPYYTKYLAEVIALGKNNNQYFISTHNPYFLLPLVEKAPKEDIGIFITYFEDYQTKVKPLSEKQLEEMMEIDVFSNIERFLEEK